MLESRMVQPFFIRTRRLLATRAEMAAVAKTPQVRADTAALCLLDRLASAVAPLVPLNVGFIVTRTPVSLTIQSGSAAGASALQGEWTSRFL